jgi:hypothetical protein
MLMKKSPLFRISLFGSKHTTMREAFNLYDKIWEMINDISVFQTSVLSFKILELRRFLENTLRSERQRVSKSIKSYICGSPKLKGSGQAGESHRNIMSLTNQDIHFKARI